MRIVIDLLSLGYGGSETYPLEVLPFFGDSVHQVHVLLAHGRGEHLRQKFQGHLNFLTAPRYASNPVLRFFYQKYKLPQLLREVDAEVLFVPGGSTSTRPNSRCRVVTMLRNMLPFDRSQKNLFPVLRYPGKRLRYWLLAQELTRTFKKADRVIFISEYSKEFLMPRLGKIDCRVIPHGVSMQCHSLETASDDLLRRYGIKYPYFLYLSIFKPYKHQLEVISGFERYRSEIGENWKTQLVLAGPTSGHYGETVLRQIGLTNGAAVSTGSVTREDLPALIRGAKILLFASTCETCPNILLEYLASGGPIICSRTQPMPEIGSDAVLYVDANDPDDWYRALKHLTENPDVSQYLGEAGLERSKAFTWSATAEKTIAALTEW